MAEGGRIVGFWDFLRDRREVLAFEGFQHASMVAQCVLLGAVLAIVLACAIYRNDRTVQLATSLSAIGLTIPSFALLGILIAPLGLGVAPAVTALVFYASLPILRNAVVGLSGVDKGVVESARGMGMNRLHSIVRIELPLAWPVILAGIRVSTQMVMGIAAIAAYVNGPGLGGLIFNGLSRLGGANALNSAIAGTLTVVVLALVFDAILVGIGRLTISRGIRV
jgi:osmoprotectant transport system permease protein